MARIGKKQLILLQKKYQTDEAIARLYNLSRQAIHQLRNRYGIPPVQSRNKKRDSEIKQMRKKGISVLKLSRKFKLSTTHIYRIINDL